jgi:hypothetical protein
MRFAYLVSLALIVLSSNVFANGNYVFAVMDFTTPDSESMKYLQHNKARPTSEQPSLITETDKSYLSSYDLANVVIFQMMERYKNKKREDYINYQDDQRVRDQKERFRSDTLSSSLGRAVILASDMLAAELSKHPEIGELVDRRTIEESVSEMNFQNSGLVANNAVIKLGELTGATHLIFGIVSDYSKKVVTQMSYGTPSKSIKHSLDLTVKIVDIKTNKLTYATTVTSEINELSAGGGSEYDTGLMKKLLKTAVVDATSDITKGLQKRNTKGGGTAGSNIAKVSIAPKDSTGKQLEYDLEIDGEYSGNTPVELSLTEGSHTVALLRNDKVVWKKEINVKNGIKISPTIN